MTRGGWIIAVLLSHWKRHPVQLATLLAGLISATALWSGVQAINQQARTSYDRAAATFGGGQLATVVAQDGGTFPQDLFIDLRRAGWPVSPVLEGRIQIGGRSVRLLGIEPVTLPRGASAAPEIGKVDLQTFIMAPGQARLSLETLNDLGLRDGDIATTSDGNTLPPLKLQSELIPGVIVLDIGFAQKLLKLPGRVSRLLIGDQTGRSLPPLESIAGGRLRVVEAGAESDLERLTDSFHINLTAFGLLSFFVGLFIVNSAIGLALEQRLPMLRTLRASGVSSRGLIIALLIELVSIAALAGLVGLVCGYLIAALLLPDVAASLNGLYGAKIPGELTLEPRWWLLGLAVSVVGALAAAAGSLVKVMRLPLLVSAQPYAWRQAQQHWLRWQAVLSIMAFTAALASFVYGDGLIAGFAVLAGILVGAALGLPVVLGWLLKLGEAVTTRPLAQWFWADSRQQLSGLSLSLMALLLALAVNVGVGTMVGSFSKTFTGWLDGRLASEVYLSATSDAQADAIKGWLRQRPEVEAVLPSGRADVQIGGWPVEILGLADHATYRDQWPLLESSRDAWDRVATGDAVLVSEQLSRRQRIRLGDRIRIPTPRGDWVAVVSGVYPDYGNPKNQVTVNTEQLYNRFPDVARTRLGLRVAPAAVPALITALRTEFALDERRVADQATLKAESKRIFNRTFAVTAALNAFTLGVAGVALLTSLLTLSNTRLPQLAPLWAIGITRRRLARIELTKTMALAFITALFALPLGLLVAWCLVAIVNVKAFGWRLPLYVFPFELLQLLGVAMLASLLAACWPLLKLARMPPAHLIKIFADER